MMIKFLFLFVVFFLSNLFYYDLSDSIKAIVYILFMCRATAVKTAVPFITKKKSLSSETI